MTLSEILASTASKLDAAESAPPSSEVRCTRVTAALAIAKLRAIVAMREARTEIRASRCTAASWYRNASPSVAHDYSDAEPATLRSEGTVR